MNNCFLVRQLWISNGCMKKLSIFNVFTINFIFIINFSFVENSDRLNRFCSTVHLHPVLFNIIVIDRFLSYFSEYVNSHQLKSTLNMLREMKAYYDAKLAPRQCLIILMESREILKNLPRSLLSLLESFCHMTLTMQSTPGKGAFEISIFLFPSPSIDQSSLISSSYLIPLFFFPDSDTSLYVMNVTQIHGQPDPTDFRIFYRINWISRELRVSRSSYDPKADIL